MAKKINDTVKAYRRERARINRAIRELKKYGFDNNINVPTIPKKITQASVRRLQNISTRKIYESATGARPITGEQINFREFRVVWRRISDNVKNYYKDTLKALNFRKEISDLIKEQRERFDESIVTKTPDSPVKTVQKHDDSNSDILRGWQVAYDNFMDIIENYADRAYSIVKQRVSILENQYGKQAVGEMFIEASESGVMIEPSDSYNVGLIYRMLSSFARILQLNENDTKEFISSITDSDYFEGDFFE